MIRNLTAQHGRIVNIYICTHSNIVQTGLSALLERQGEYKVSSFVNYKQLILKIKSGSPDILIIDSNLPDLSLRQISDLVIDMKNIPVLLLMPARGVPEEKLFEYLFYGVRGWIRKDINPENLTLAIRKVLDGEIWARRRLISNALTRFIAILNHYEIDPTLKHPITRREREILELAVCGKRNNEIAKTLFITESTVKTHLFNIYKKLNISSRYQLMKHKI